MKATKKYSRRAFLGKMGKGLEWLVKTGAFASIALFLERKPRPLEAANDNNKKALFLKLFTSLQKEFNRMPKEKLIKLVADNMWKAYFPEGGSWEKGVKDREKAILEFAENVVKELLEKGQITEIRKKERQFKGMVMDLASLLTIKEDTASIGLEIGKLSPTVNQLLEEIKRRKRLSEKSLKSLIYLQSLLWANALAYMYLKDKKPKEK